MNKKEAMFLYSQDLSNSKTAEFFALEGELFLYSQDLSNSKTVKSLRKPLTSFCTLKI